MKIKDYIKDIYRTLKSVLSKPPILSMADYNNQLNQKVEKMLLTKYGLRITTDKEKKARHKESLLITKKLKEKYA